MKLILKKILEQFSNRIWMLSFIAIGLVAIYWGIIASDRYVSKAHVVLQSPDIAPPDLSFSSMISGTASNNTADLLLLRDHMLSMDMLLKVSKELELGKHYSSQTIDYFSRLSSADLPAEYLHDYLLQRVDVTLDDYSGVLIVKAIAFDPETSQYIVNLLLKYGEQHMNQMGQRLAQEQVNFIEKQVKELSQKLVKANQAVLDYQNQQGLLSPTETAVGVGAVITQLNAELVSQQTKLSALSTYQSSKSPDIVQLKAEISSIKRQIHKEQAKLTSYKDRALNKISLDYEELKLKAQFAQELYANSLATLEATRVEAARKLKQVSVLAKPNLPEYAIEPDRAYIISVFSLLILISALLFNMVLTIIRDHKD